MRAAKPGIEGVIAPSQLRELLAQARGAVSLADPLGGLGSRPGLYELDASGCQLKSQRELLLGAPLGDGDARTSWTVGASELGTLSPRKPEPPAILVQLSRSRSRAEFLDLLALRVTVVSDGAFLLRRRLVSQAVSGFWSEQARVLVLDTGIEQSLSRWDPTTPIVTCADPHAMLEEIAASATTWDLETRPTLCVLGPEVSPGAVEFVAAALERHRGVGVLASNPSNRTRAIVSCEPNGTSAAYFRASSRRNDQFAITPRAALPLISPASTENLPARLAQLPIGSAPISINVLGPVTVEGGSESVERRPRITELISYLSMHKEGALTRAWSLALWPERRVPAQTIANRLSEARRALGIAADGRPRLRRNGERHQIVDVLTDWELFGRLADPEQPVESWHRALELVRGRPFDDLPQGQWTVLEGFLGEIESAIAECALRAATRDLAEEKPELAHWALSAALRANPFDERLYRMLMRSADAAGNRAGVEEVLRLLALALEIDGDPLHGVHPRTASLYHELIGN